MTNKQKKVCQLARANGLGYSVTYDADNKARVMVDLRDSRASIVANGSKHVVWYVRGTYASTITQTELVEMINARGQKVA